MEFVQRCFVTCVYQNLSDTIRKLGFSSITPFGEINDETCLKQIISLIGDMGKDNPRFCREEWDHPLEEMLSKDMESVVEKWNQCSIPSFLANVHRQALVYRSMLILEESKALILSRFYRVVSQRRSKVFFRNDGEEFVRLLHKGRCEDWQKIFCLFGTDKPFISMISKYLDWYVQQVFCKTLGARLQALTDDEVFQELLTAWSRFDNILRNAYISTVTEKDEFVIDSIRRPFRYLVSKPPRNINFERLAAKHAHSLLSRNGEEKQALQVSRVEELQQVIFFASLFPDTDAFIQIYRTMLANRLLEGTHESLKMELQTIQELFQDFSQSADIFRLLAMIEDTSSWSQFEHQFAQWTRMTSNAINMRGFTSQTMIIRSFKWPDIPEAQLKLPRKLEIVKGIYPFTNDSAVADLKSFVHRP